MPELISTTRTTPSNDLLVRAARGEHTVRTPVWLMRQAGRYDPEYQRIRAEAGLELEDLFHRPDHAATITVLPMRFGVDGAILFQDILTPLAPLGTPFVFRPGPVLDSPVRTPKDVERLEPFDVREQLAFVPESIERVLDLLDGEAPLIGFAGAPWTLAAFLIEGGSPSKSDGHVAAFIRNHPEAAHRLLSLLASMTGDYLRMQIESGVHMLQLFESCADLLSPQAYREFALPYQQQVFEHIGGEVPRIIFAKGTVDPQDLLASGAEVLSVSEKADLRQLRNALPQTVALQGNVDNMLLRDGPIDAIEHAVRDCIDAGGSRGHILNLGHGILKDTPLEHVIRFIETAKAVAPA
jgi:uroporphyrinogen decarboxylase